jgi:hypothetical protein
LRAQGLRPIQIWVPDVRAPSFIAAARKQAKAVAASRHAKKDQSFIDAVGSNAVSRSRAAPHFQPPCRREVL